jgi:hypothetical protein
MFLKKIISGGQTGADQGALEAAKHLNLETGGWMPRGFRTETIPRPEFQTLYNMQETESFNYPSRTEWNICQATGTLLFGRSDTPGSKLTKDLCKRHGTALIEMYWGGDINPPNQDRIEFFQFWLNNAKITILNVAGNRESKNPGIQVATKNFLIAALQES